MNRKINPGNSTAIMELSWKSHGILFYTLRGNPDIRIYVAEAVLTCAHNVYVWEK